MLPRGSRAEKIEVTEVPETLQPVLHRVRNGYDPVAAVRDAKRKSASGTYPTDTIRHSMAGAATRLRLHDISQESGNPRFAKFPSAFAVPQDAAKKARVIAVWDAALRRLLLGLADTVS